MANPAAVYCTELGYEFMTVDDPSGQGDICRFPSGGQCDAWEFLQGTCGQAYSYCAREGYDIVTVDDGRDPFTPEYAVCVLEKGRAIGSLTQLFGLSAKAERSGCSQDRLADPPPPKPAAPVVEAVEVAADLPASFDWRNHQSQNWLTPIRNQGGCGSCWAFSAVGVVEAAYNIHEQNPGLDKDLAEQYLVSDCTGVGTCCGGWAVGALEFIEATGVVDESCMGYVDGNGCSCAAGTCATDCTYRAGACSDRTCTDRCPDWSGRLIRIGAAVSVEGQAAIKEALVEHGPLSVNYGHGSTYGGSFDGNGIYRCTNDQGSNHAVVLVGYDDAGGYWIIRNSWGTGYGDGGYFRIGYGECSIDDSGTYVLVEVPPTPNDDFVAASVLQSLPADRDQTTLGATVEPNEPLDCGWGMGATVWFKYEPETDFVVTAETTGSNYDTVLAVHRGSTLAGLVPIACNDDYGATLQSRVRFEATAGDTYWLQVGGYEGESGELHFHAEVVPPICGGRSATRWGTDGDDVLIGTDGNDVIAGLGGDDEIDGGAGNDLICGGNGSDTLVGGVGADRLWGGAGGDRLLGGDGSDRLYGEDHNDVLNGGGEIDWLYGGDGADRLYGGPGNDTAYGQGGRDRLFGHGGVDILYGGEQLDWLYGGEGNDRLYGGAGNDAVYGQGGNDRMWGQGGTDLLNGGLGFDIADGGALTDTCRAEAKVRCE